MFDHVTGPPRLRMMSVPSLRALALRRHSFSLVVHKQGWGRNARMRTAHSTQANEHSRVVQLPRPPRKLL
jgi:hypothetical protein